MMAEEIGPARGGRDRAARESNTDRAPGCITSRGPGQGLFNSHCTGQLVLLHPDLTKADALIYDALSEFANQGRAWPSVETLAEITELTRRGVQKSLRRLEAAGFIPEVEYGGGSAGSNVYTLRQGTFERSPIAERIRRHCAERDRRRPARLRRERADAGRGEQPFAGGANSRSPKPSLLNPLDDDDDAERARARDGAPPDRVREVDRRVLEIMGVASDPRWHGRGRADRWIAEGCDPELDILPAVARTMARKPDPGPPCSLLYFDREIARALRERTESMPKARSRRRREARESPYETLRRGAYRAATRDDPWGNFREGCYHAATGGGPDDGECWPEDRRGAA